MSYRNTYVRQNIQQNRVWMSRDCKNDRWLNRILCRKKTWVWGIIQNLFQDTFLQPSSQGNLSLFEDAWKSGASSGYDCQDDDHRCCQGFSLPSILHAGGPALYSSPWYVVSYLISLPIPRATFTAFYVWRTRPGEVPVLPPVTQLTDW